MNIQQYKQRLLDLETTLSARIAHEADRAGENSSMRPMTLATRASRTRWLQRTSSKLNTIQPCCNRCATRWAAWPMARSARASSTVEPSKSHGSRPSPGLHIV